MDENEATMQGTFHDISVDHSNKTEGMVTDQPLDPLALDIDDAELAEIVDTRVDATRRFYKEKHLYDRRVTNETHLFGRQILVEEEKKNLKNYESRYLDNGLYEIEGNLKPLAMSRIPDLIITPGQESEQSQLMAKEISKAVDSQVKSREIRRVLGLAFKHRPVYFTGIIKVRWDPEKDDYVFENIHPDMVDFDHTAPTNNADDMQFIRQLLPLTVQEVIMQFPKKEEEFKKELAKDGIKVSDGKLSYKQLATTINISEVWFTWYKKHTDREWERVEGVLWKYHDLILDKMKNPNFDYEGTSQLFEYSGNEKRPMTNENQMNAFFSGIMPPNVKEETVYSNYFDKPKKPFFFMGYDQWGRNPMDETSRIEQNLQNQKSLDRQGRQIEETLANRGHHVWSKESGLKPDMVMNMDMNDPDMDVIVDGPPSQVHEYIPPQRPDKAEFDNLSLIKSNMHALAGDNAINGTVQSDVATTNQIARESNFTKADDEVEDTINAAAEWIAGWSLQMIKLRYTEDHFRKLLGTAGSVVFLKLNRNMIEDGMEVMIKSSGTDKLKARNDAQTNAKLGVIDPLSYNRDMGYPDYEARTEMFLSFKTNISEYIVKYIMNLPTSDAQAQALMAQPASSPPFGGQPSAPGTLGMSSPQASVQAIPQQPQPGNTAQAPVAPPQGPPQASPRSL